MDHRRDVGSRPVDGTVVHRVDRRFELSRPGRAVEVDLNDVVLGHVLVVDTARGDETSVAGLPPDAHVAGCPGHQAESEHLSRQRYKLFSKGHLDRCAHVSTSLDCSRLGRLVDMTAKRSEAASQRSSWSGSNISGLTASDTIRLASANDPTRPSAAAWTARLPSTAASAGPAMTSRPLASATHWQYSRLRDPPPITRIVVIRSPVTASIELTASAAFKARLSRIARVISAGSVGSGSPLPRQIARMIAGTSTASRRVGSFGSKRPCSGFALAAATSNSSSSRSSPLRRQASRLDSSSQKPAMTDRRSVWPPTPPSLVRPASNAGSPMV